MSVFSATARFDSRRVHQLQVTCFQQLISESISDTAVASVLDRLGIQSMEAIPNLAILKELVTELERLAGEPAA